MSRFFTVLDTGVGSGYIRKYILPQWQWPLIQPLHESVQIQDAGNRSVNVAGKITLVAELKNRVEALSFYVVQHLSTKVLLDAIIATNISKQFDLERESLNWKTVLQSRLYESPEGDTTRFTCRKGIRSYHQSSVRRLRSLYITRQR